MTACAALDIPDQYQTPLKMSVADNPRFAVGFARVFNLDRNASENKLGVLEIQASFGQSLSTLGRIEGYSHELL